MKIFYSAAGTTIPGTHGGSVHALELSRALAQRGHEVHLAALSGGAQELDIPGLVFHPLQPHGRFFEWRAASEIAGLARLVAPDVVVERFYTFGGAAIDAAHEVGVPAVLEINSPAREYPGSTRDRLDRLTLVRPVHRRRQRMLERCAALYTTSLHLVPSALRDRATVIVNGVDVARFVPGDRAPDGGPLRCVYVSSFRAWHGAEDLVNAVAAALAQGADIELVCIGAGPRWRRARALASRHGVEHRVEFLGRIAHTEVPAHLAAAHVGVAPFAPDRFRALQLGWFWSPIKIFEYLAAGLPVVTADIADLRALLPGEVARFYTPGDTAALASVLGELARNRAAVRSAAVASRRLAEERYTWGHQAAAVEAVLREVASGGL